jgi:antitoxin component of MazEF toxin-antitoxin module
MAEAVEAKVRRIGGSTFALLPPEVVKKLALHDGDTVKLEITKRGKTLGELVEELHRMPKADRPPITAEDLDFEGDKLERLARGRRTHRP